MGIKNFEPYKKSTYQWKPGHEKALRITKSSLTSDFDFCPKQYEFKRIDGRKTPQTDDMLRGTNVHDAMEVFFINVKPAVNKILGLAKDNKDEEAFELMLKCLPEPEEPYHLDEEPILQKRLEWEYARLIASDGVDYLPIMNEDELHAFFDHTVEVNGFVHTVPIHMAGAVDRGFRTEEGKVALMELKTGKWRIGDIYKPRSMRYEMAFYADLMKKADHPLKDVTHWGWLFPGGGRLGDGHEDHWGYEKVSKRYFTKVKKGFDALIEAYILNNFPPTPSEGKCAWCSFIEACPAWKEGGDKYWRAFKRPQYVNKGGNK